VWNRTEPWVECTTFCSEDNSMNNSHFLKRKGNSNKKELRSSSCTCTPKQNIITKIVQNILAVQFSGRGLWLPRRNDKNYARLKHKCWMTNHLVKSANYGAHMTHYSPTQCPYAGKTSITSLSQTSYNKSKTLTWDYEIAECMLTLDNRGNYQMTQRCYSDQPLHLPDPLSVVATDQKIYYLQSSTGSAHPLFYIN